MVQVRHLLPCERCRYQFGTCAASATKQVGTLPSSPEQMFRWLYYLKDAVNRETKTTSPITYDDAKCKAELRMGVIDYVAIADFLIFAALYAEKANEECLFTDLTQNIARLLPYPESRFQSTILNADISTPAVLLAYRASTAARAERGCNTVSLSWYRCKAAE